MKTLRLLLLFSVLVYTTYAQESFIIQGINSGQNCNLQMDSIVEYNLAKNEKSILYITTNNDDGQVVYHEGYIFDKEANRWSKDICETGTYDYNKDGGLKEGIFSFFTNNILNTTSRERYTYNDDGNITGWFEEIWNEKSKLWINSSKKEYEYNEDGKIFSEINWDWVEDKWKGVVKKEYEYEYKTNRLKQEVAFDWIDEWNVWSRDANVSDYEYDENGFLLKERKFHYSCYDCSVSSYTQKYPVTTYTCDSNGKVLEKLMQYLNINDKYKRVYKYDDSGNMLLDAYYKWDYSTAMYWDYDWIGVEKIEKTYNECNQVASCKISDDWDYDLGWVDSDLSVIYYSFRTPNGLGVDIGLDEGKIYLKGNDLVIDLDNILLTNVYSASGKFMGRFNSNNIATTSWDKGIYIVYVKLAGGSVRTAKILK